MFFNERQARELEALVGPEVESAILKMLDIAEEHAKVVMQDPKATFEELKLYQGKLIVLNDLRKYRERLTIAVKNG